MKNTENSKKHTRWSTSNNGKIVPFSDCNLPTEFVMEHFKGAAIVGGDLLLPICYDMDSIREKYKEGICPKPAEDQVNDIHKIIKERGKTHGNFRDQAYCAQSLKSVIKESPNYDRMSDVQKEALDMILHKIGRILAGNPDYKDHWVDIEGYANLISRNL